MHIYYHLLVFSACSPAEIVKQCSLIAVLFNSNASLRFEMEVPIILCVAASRNSSALAQTMAYIPHIF